MTRPTEKLALHGGLPVRENFLPYGRQNLVEEDIVAVEQVLRSDWLTTGPKINELETHLSEVTGTEFAVAVSSGTAALHGTMFALGISSGDEVIVPAITFAATANAVLYQGGVPVFVDVDSNTLLIDLEDINRKITAKTKAIVSMDYAGHPCQYESLVEVAERHGLALVADASHSLGASYKGHPVAQLVDMSTYSFHPVKHITSGEGGAVATNDASYARMIRLFRNHGITTDHHDRLIQRDHSYQMTELGYNYRITDFQCALAGSQLKRLPDFLQKRRAIANYYNQMLEQIDGVTPLAVSPDVSHAYHLYVVKIETSVLSVDRDTVFMELRAENIGVNVNYVPVYWHPYYSRLGYERGICPVSERVYDTIISLPLFYEMTDSDVSDVVHAVRKVVQHHTGY